MTTLILLVYCLLTLNQVLGASQFNINCKFSNETFLSKSSSCCSVVEDLKIGKENVTLIIQISQDKKRTLAFSAKNKEIFYLPKGIGIAFINLEILEIFNSSLKKITAENLKEFAYLKELNLSHNKIEYLESNLFQHNSKLKFVNLNDNLISLVEPTFMKTRQDITVFALERNVCYSGSAGDKAELDGIIETVKILCSSFIKNIKFNLVESDRKIQECFTEQSKLNTIVEVLINRSNNYEQLQKNQSQLLDSLQNQGSRFNLSIIKLQNEMTAVKEFPVKLSNLTTILKDVEKTCSFKIQSMENKYSGMLNKTIDIEKNLKNTNTEINNIRSKAEQYQKEFDLSKVKSVNISIDLNKIWNEISRINKQSMILTNSTQKSINDIKAGLSLNLANIKDKVKFAEKSLSEKIINNVKNITSQINDTGIRCKKNLETLLSNTDKKLLEKSKDIEAISKLFNPTNEKLANLTNKCLKLAQKDESFEQRLDNFETLVKDTQSTLSNVSNKLQLTESTINTKLIETIETLFIKNLTVLDNKHHVAINQMQDQIKYLIISNVILIILLILAVSYFIYNLKIKIKSNTYNHIQRNNSSCHQFNTISTHVPLYDQYNEPVYDSTNQRDEPIYEAFESPYLEGDSEHYQTADNVKYAQVEFNLYETTDDSANLVHKDQEGLFNDSMYDVTSRDNLNEEDNNSHNDSADGDVIYEAAGHSETIKADSTAPIAVSEENLYSELPTKINSNQDEFELYSIVKKG